MCKKIVFRMLRNLSYLIVMIFLCLFYLASEIVADDGKNISFHEGGRGGGWGKTALNNRSQGEVEATVRIPSGTNVQIQDALLPVEISINGQSPVSGAEPAITEVDFGYFIWISNDEIWHVRWTGNDGEHMLSGTIFSEGTFRNLRTIGSTTKVLRQRVGVITFSGKTSSITNGIDFTCSTKAVTFNLQTDETNHESNIYIGEFRRNPGCLPFMIEVVKGVSESEPLVGGIGEKRGK